jgi:hypothetical protein
MPEYLIQREEAKEEETQAPTDEAEDAGPPQEATGEAEGGTTPSSADAGGTNEAGTHSKPKTKGHC